MMAVLAEFSAGALSIDVDDASAVDVTVDNAEVLVNGVAPTNLDSPEIPLQRRRLPEFKSRRLVILIIRFRLPRLPPAISPNFVSAVVDGGAGNDDIIGTAFGDRLFGGLGNDAIQGLGGDDLVVGGSGDDQLNGGDGNDLVDGGGQVSVTVTNLAPSSGTLLTPVFLATGNGVYDFFDEGAAASPNLESLAEDGDVSGRIAAALNSGGVAEAQATPGGPLTPGDSRTVYFNASALDDLAQYLSYASMVIPSNDAFVGNDNPEQIDLFDDDGNLISRIGGNAFVVSGDEVWDAGTEVNDEVPANTAALAQAAPNTGVTENGVIRRHEGFQGVAGARWPDWQRLGRHPQR